MINNRQNNNRRRNRSGPRPQGSGNRPEQGNRIDNRARGNAPQLLEKYKNLARDAQMQGDRVMTEYYLQFADHYFRVLADNRLRYEEQQAQRRQQHDMGGEFEGVAMGVEGEPIPLPGRAPYNPKAAEAETGEEGPRESASADSFHGEEERPRAPRARRMARSENEGLRPRRMREEETAPASAQIDVAVLPPSLGESQPAPGSDDEQPAPRRRGRPRRVVKDAEQPAPSEA